MQNTIARQENKGTHGSCQQIWVLNVSVHSGLSLNMKEKKAAGVINTMNEPFLALHFHDPW
jgi:hypothetical protein